MEPCLDPASVGFQVDLPTYLGAARAGGFTLVEVPIHWVAAAAADRGAEAVAEMFTSRRLTPVQFTCGLGIPGNIAVGEDLFQSRLRDLAGLSALGTVIGCQRASLFVDEHHHEGGPLSDDVLVQRIRAIAEILAPTGLELSLGLVGRRHLMSAAKLLANVGRSDVGLLVDSISMEKANLGVEWIDKLPSGAVRWFRVADAPTDVAGADLTYADRLLPGAGRLPLPQLLKAIRRNGYLGPVSVEVGDPAMGNHSAHERARLAYVATVAALTRPTARPSAGAEPR